MSTEKDIALLNFALDNVRQAALLIDKDARFRYVNEESCRALGYSREELLGLGIADIHPDFPIERWPDHWDELKERGSITFEGHHRTKDGWIFPVEISANYFEYGRQGYSLALVRDITERKRVEDTLRFIAQRGWAGTAGTFLTALAGYLADTLGMDYVLIAHLLDGGYSMAETSALYAKGEILPNIRYELRGTPCENVMGKRLCLYPKGIQALFPADTTLVDMGAESYAGIPLWDSAGRPIGLLAALDGKPLHDENMLSYILQLVATSAAAALERERHDRLLMAREREFRTLAENSPDCILRYDSGCRCIYANPRIENTLRIPAGGMLGKTPMEIFPTGEYREYQDRIEDVLETGADADLEVVLPDTGGEVRYHHVRFTAESDQEGAITGVLVIGRDITERKQAEEKLKEYRDHLEDLIEQRTDELVVAKEHAEAANRAKSAFLANMSHELRTPLNIILGFTQLMDRDPIVSETHGDTLAMIGRSGEHLLTLIDDVLEMSRIEAGHSALNKRCFDLHQALLNIAEMMHSRATAKGLHLRVELDPCVPRFISTDEAKLRQVLLNLIGNAVKYTSKGSVILRVSRINETEVEKETPLYTSPLRFEVEDTGIGIAPEQVLGIFDPFVQARDGQPVREGTGLGLAISREYVQLMGSDIHVESKLQIGSIFWFDLQVELAEAAEIIEEDLPARRVVGLIAGQPQYRILIVEDMQESRLLLRKLLESVGFEVREAGNGQEAIEQFEQWDPHLIWMDMRMPVMDGYEATRNIKARGRPEETKIICISASPFEEQRTLALSSGCDHFVRKPFRETDIFEAMRKHLGVEYVYDVEGIPFSRKTWGDTSQVQVDPAKLAALPADMLESLARAAKSLKVSDILAIVEQIRKLDQDTGDLLADLAKSFRYDVLLTTIRRVSPEFE